MAVKSLPGYKPLCFINKVLYLYKKGYVYALVDSQLSKIVHIYPSSIKEVSRFTSRLFRTEPKYAVPVGMEKMLIVGHRKILLVDIETKAITEVANSREGFSDPLNVCESKEKWVSVWGDYGPNPDGESINIYGMTSDNKVDRIFSFEKGQIRHIHNIIPRINGGYYIFTGDQEERAGIYKTDSKFEKVEPVKVGKQQYRAVVGFDTPKGLLYATDAVNERNYVYLLRADQEPEKLYDLNGSCIYGTEYHGSYYFSTTVEPDENNRGLLSWVSKKRGKGILSDEVYLVAADSQMQFRIVVKQKKDFLPMKLMQYGAVQFPRGILEELWCYPVAVKSNDGNAMLLQGE